MDGSERVIQSLRFSNGSIEVTWLARGEIHEDGRTYLVHSIHFTSTDHPQAIAHFEHQVGILLSTALIDWEDSDPVLRVPNSQTELRSVLRYPIADVPDLTSRERQLLDFLIEGFTLTKISGSLGISNSTTKAHMAALYKKLGAHNQATAVVAAIKAGLVKIE